LLHFSTDYVFDGKASAPYRADAPVDPLGAYGRTKAAGEQAIHASGARHLIVRTSWLYAPWGNNFVRTMARLTRDKPSLKVVDDQRGRPTSAEHLAATALALLDRGATGTFHVTDGGECTWYEFTLAIAKQLGRTCTIAPCTTAEFPRPAPRPAYSVLDLSQTEALLGPMPDWRVNLVEVLARLEPL
jgi:dTDP-4-dehydrorhamnose reductase